MKKLFTAFLMVFVLSIFLIGLLGITASAETEGYYTYTVVEGEAQITECDTSISGNIIIPSTLGGYPVTTIGDSAFYFCHMLTGVVIPDGVTTIGDSAFSRCSYLESVTIGSNVTTIGNLAFDTCTSLRSVTIPNSVITIGEGAFNGCDNLTKFIYCGSQKQWNKVNVKALNDSVTKALQIHDCQDDSCTVCGKNNPAEGPQTTTAENSIRFSWWVLLIVAILCFGAGTAGGYFCKDIIKKN